MDSTVHININSLIMLIGGFQGIFFAVLLFFKYPQRRAINIYLSIILAAFGLELFHQFLIESNYIYQLKPLVGAIFPLDAAVAISLYWYVRKITHPDLDNSFKSVSRHYIILLICIVLSLPFWLLDFESKLNVVASGFSPVSWPEEIYYYLFTLFSLEVAVFCVYFYLSVQMLVQHKRRIMNIFSYREKVTLSWLTNLLWFFGIGFIQILILLSVFDNIAKSIQVIELVGISTTILVIYIGVMGLMQPRIYRRKETFIIDFESSEDEEVTSTKDTESDKPKKYQKSALSTADMDRIADKLSLSMHNDKLYLESDLTMPKLAASVAISPNYLSQTLNVKFKESFFDYINRQRIDYAKIQLGDTKRSKVSVLDIAMESAFNSKSAFYSAFKKHSGITPVQYRLTKSA